MSTQSRAETTADRASFRNAFKTISSLFKMRVVSLLLGASIAGAFLGQRGVPSIVTLAVLMVTGSLAAGGASAINQYLERDTDPNMKRTSRRPLATGKIRHPAVVLWVAIAMILVAVFSVLPTNPAMAFYLGLGALIYVGVYTIWLKPRSVLNIVIGGAAGSCAVMAGGAAVGAASDPAVIVLALLVFLWTPAHFWALAMMYKDDYATAHVPMLPVNASAGSTAWWILLHTASTSLAALTLAVIPALGLIYAVPTAIVTGVFVLGSIYLLRYPDRSHAIRLFITSNIFLALVLLAIIIAASGHQFLNLLRL